jgi:hypothetical protein
MGYRSKVKACVYGAVEKVDLYVVKHKMQYGNKNVFEQFKTAGEDNGVYVKGISFKEKEAFTYVNSEGKTVEGRPKYKIVDLDGSDWKWYDDFEDVKMWHKFMEEAEEFGLMWEFVRVGESSDDIEEKNGGEEVEYFLYPVTDIACEY